MAIRLLTQWKGKAQQTEMFIQKGFRFRNNITLCSASGIRRVMELRDLEIGVTMSGGRDLSILNDDHTYAIYYRTHPSNGHYSDIKYDETVHDVIDRFTVTVIEPKPGALYQDFTEIVIFELGVTGLE